jgi:hypothetical protein
MILNDTSIYFNLFKRGKRNKKILLRWIDEEIKIIKSIMFGRKENGLINQFIIKKYNLHFRRHTTRRLPDSPFDRYFHRAPLGALQSLDSNDFGDSIA